MEKTDHTSKGLIDVYLCAGCLLPKFDTRFRQCFYPGKSVVLATQFRLDEFHVVINYAWNFPGDGRENHTTIYRHAIGFMESILDLAPITWDWDHLVHDFDTVLKLPFHDPVLLKRKLQLYTLFS